jgi:predicted kinase
LALSGLQAADPQARVMRPEVAILVGLPGAGKSTFYRQRLAATHRHVSKDLLQNVKNKQARQDALVRDALRAGQSVVIDNTNVSPAERATVIAIARELGARVVGHYIEATTREAVARNERREDKKGRVPKVAIFTCAKRLVPPSVEEGFDALHTWHVTDDDGFMELTKSSVP